MSEFWSWPVHVRIGTGRPDIIRGPTEAFAALNHRWPAEHGFHYGAARRLCSLAVAGKAPAEVAREAFIAAALEAAVLDERLQSHAASPGTNLG
jgi:hypothetical protein